MTTSVTGAERRSMRVSSTLISCYTESDMDEILDRGKEAEVETYSYL